MRKNVALLLVVALALLNIIHILPVDAEFSSVITIGADGMIHPTTAPLRKVGNVYALTNDFNGQVIVNCSNIILDGKNHRLTSSSELNYRITLNDVSNVTVINFIIVSGAKGIDIRGKYNTIKNNTVSRIDNGIFALSQPTAAVALSDASSNLITGNHLESNRVGISLVSLNPKQCRSNQIVGNNFLDCSIAILVYDSSNNKFYHNNFIDNQVLLQDNGYYGSSLPSFNVWDDGVKFGNYWSDYKSKYPDATEINGRGVGDIAYFVKPSNFVDPETLTRQQAKDHWTKINNQYLKNTDRYPLIRPLNPVNYLPKTISLTVSVLSPLSQIYNESSVPLVFVVDKQAVWIGYSLNRRDNVTVSGNTTLGNLVNGEYNLTLYATNFAGNTGASETLLFTVDLPLPKTFPILPVVASGASVVLVGAAGLLYYYKKRRQRIRA